MEKFMDTADGGRFFGWPSDDRPGDYVLDASRCAPDLGNGAVYLDRAGQEKLRDALSAHLAATAPKPAEIEVGSRVRIRRVPPCAELQIGDVVEVRGITPGGFADDVSVSVSVVPGRRRSRPGRVQWYGHLSDVELVDPSTPLTDETPAPAPSRDVDADGKPLELDVEYVVVEIDGPALGMVAGERYTLTRLDGDGVPDSKKGYVVASRLRRAPATPRYATGEEPKVGDRVRVGPEPVWTRWGTYGFGEKAPLSGVAGDTLRVVSGGAEQVKHPDDVFVSRTARTGSGFRLAASCLSLLPTEDRSDVEYRKGERFMLDDAGAEVAELEPGDVVRVTSTGTPDGDGDVYVAHDTAGGTTEFYLPAEHLHTPAPEEAPAPRFKVGDRVVVPASCNGWWQGEGVVTPSDFPPSLLRYVSVRMTTGREAGCVGGFRADELEPAPAPAVTWTEAPKATIDGVGTAPRVEVGKVYRATRANVYLAVGDLVRVEWDRPGDAWILVRALTGRYAGLMVGAYVSRLAPAERNPEVKVGDRVLATSSSFVSGPRLVTVTAHAPEGYPQHTWCGGREDVNGTPIYRHVTEWYALPAPAPKKTPGVFAVGDRVIYRVGFAAPDSYAGKHAGKVLTVKTADANGSGVVVCAVPGAFDLYADPKALDHA